MITLDKICPSISLLGITPQWSWEISRNSKWKWNELSALRVILGVTGQSLIVSGLFPHLFRGERSLGIVWPWHFEVFSFEELARELSFKQIHLCKEMSLVWQEVALDTGQNMGRCLGSQETKGLFVSSWFTAEMTNPSEQLSVRKYVTSNIHWVKHWSLSC